MAAAEILAWIAKTVGGQLVKDGMGRTALKRENRSLKKALLESQERREELEATAEIIARIALQRDSYFAEIVKLRAENVELRIALESRTPDA